MIDVLKTLATEFLGQKAKVVGDKWVMTNCPFAPWLHPDGDDKKYSFGMSITGGFHCFTCGMKGSIYDLPVLLARYTHIPQFALEDFIKENFYPARECALDVVPQVECLDEQILCYYPYANEGILHLTKADIIKWNIRFDHHRGLLLFPIYLYGKLHCIKVRSVDKKVFWVIGNMRLKQTGNWYGDWFKPRRWLFLVEGERDAIFLSRYTTAWASLGEPTKRQFEYIVAYWYQAKPNVCLFFDNDDVGRRMTEKAIRCLGSNLPLWMITDYCGCKDPAEIIEKGLLKEALKSISKI